MDTVAQIADDVRRDLESVQGQAKVRRMDGLVAALLDQRDRLRKPRIHARPGVTFHVSTSAIKGMKQLSLDVRVLGIRGGRVTFEKEQILLSVSGGEVNPRLRETTSPMPWSSQAARKRIDIQRKRVKKHWPAWEAGIEAAVVAQMHGHGKRKARGPLRNHQPVRFLGVPIQFPCPVTPKSQNTATLGHIDLLVRHSRGTLRVFEIKRPGAADVLGALAQAVRYAAALSYLMARPERRPDYWSLFGSRLTDQSPRLDAVAFVDKAEADRVGLRAAACAMNIGNKTGIGLVVMTYVARPLGAGYLPWLDVETWSPDPVPRPTGVPTEGTGTV